MHTYYKYLMYVIYTKDITPKGPEADLVIFKKI